MSSMRDQSKFLPKFPGLALGIAGVSLGLLGLIILAKTVKLIPAGQVGVQESLGQIRPQPLLPGLHLQAPWSRLMQFPTRTQEFKETVEAPSQEGLMLEVDVSVLYRLDPAKAVQLYQSVGADYGTVIIVPQVRSLIRETTARYPATRLYTSERQALAERLRTDLNQTLGDRGIIVEEALLRNVILPENLQQSIQAKLQSEQESQRMKFVLEKEKQEAERKRIEAQGNADAQAILAKGLSDRTLQFRQIEAMEKLAASQNSKVVILGGDGKSAPVLLQP